MGTKKQCTDSILMIRPKHFGFNNLTATSNFFQHRNSLQDINVLAQNEFDQALELLRASGIEVFVFDDMEQIITPDSVFPNNWIILSQTGVACIFSMEAENRRLEKRYDIIETLKKDFIINSFDDYSNYENKKMFLEGTGSMVFDHQNSIAYAAISARTNVELLRLFCKNHDYTPIIFHATDMQHQPVYHTNVLMCIGEEFCVLCKESIENDSECNHVLNTLLETKKELIEISKAQMHQFAGNILQLKNKDGQLIIVISQTAFNALTSEQIERLMHHGRLVICEVNTIEQVGGGSIRCMIAEVFSEKAGKII